MKAYALGALVVLAACAQSNPFSLQNLAGSRNIAAINAAAECRNDDALVLSLSELDAEAPSERLMAHLTAAAVYTDKGNTAEANRLLAAAAADPQMNPDGTPRPEFDEPSTAILQAVRDRREETTGSRGC